MSDELQANGSGNMVHIPASWRSHAHSVSNKLKQYANNSEHIRTLLDRGRELRHGDTPTEARYTGANGFTQAQGSSGGESSTAVQKPQQKQKQTWVQWAGEKYRSTRGSSSSGSNTPVGQEHIWLFPGWATRRYRNDQSSTALTGIDEIGVSISQCYILSIYLIFVFLILHRRRAL